jgi:hypothetical protein
VSLVAAEVAAEGAKIVARATGMLSWLPWAIAAASLLGGAGGTLWYRMQWKDCEVLGGDRRQQG